MIGVITSKGILVSVDSRIPNKLVLEALKNRDIEEFIGYDEIKPEYRYYNSRLDFYLTNQFEKCLLEVKSCTLVKDCIALFPDAPTKRGKKHLRDLMKAVEEGYRACVLFIIQRNDAFSFSPNDETDPEFGNTLRIAVSKGVEVYAYSALFCRNKISLYRKVKVKL